MRDPSLRVAAKQSSLLGNALACYQKIDVENQESKFFIEALL